MSKNKYTKSLRSFRTYHRFAGITVAIILFVSAVTGLLLTWKKNVDLIQPPTKRSKVVDIYEWKSLGEIATIATATLYEQYPDQEGNIIKEIDVRPSKGVAKVQFKKGFWEVQIGGATGEVLSVAKRHSDWIEDLHDGSIISDNFKLVSMNILGFGTILLTITGFWLWFGVKLIKKRKAKQKAARISQSPK